MDVSAGAVKGGGLASGGAFLLSSCPTLISPFLSAIERNQGELKFTAFIYLCCPTELDVNKKSRLYTFQTPCLLVILSFSFYAQRAGGAVSFIFPNIYSFINSD